MHEGASKDKRGYGVVKGRGSKSRREGEDVYKQVGEQ
jgi:hypothetical protein